jgi:hypothetical protein
LVLVKHFPFEQLEENLREKSFAAVLLRFSNQENSSWSIVIYIFFRLEFNLILNLGTGSDCKRNSAPISRF